MSELNIENFPEACFYKEHNEGFLSSYFRCKSMILDYKAGKEEDINFFVNPFLKLIEYALKEMDYQKAYLIPIPSSKSYNDKNFRNKPSPHPNDPEFNRDDRNMIFCKKLKEKSQNLKCKNFILRKTGKKQKQRYETKQHKESFIRNDSVQMNEKYLFILMDDVYRSGGTTNGAMEFLQDHYPNAEIIILCLSKA